MPNGAKKKGGQNWGEKGVGWEARSFERVGGVSYHASDSSVVPDGLSVDERLIAVTSATVCTPCSSSSSSSEEISPSSAADPMDSESSSSSGERMRAG
jgi:hypothetical protein